MSITVNIYYSGENGAARRFAWEMLGLLFSMYTDVAPYRSQHLIGE